MGCFLILLAVFALNSYHVQGNDWLQNYENGIKEYFELYGAQDFPEKEYPQQFKHPPFVCPDMKPSPTVPTSVHYVKAADIKVVAALGDSLTTAIAANASNVLEVPFEYRQLSWSIGGYGTYEDVITLANIIKVFNPDVIGPAPKMTLNSKPALLNETGFNLAVTGANTYEFPDQTRHLIDTFKNFSGMNYNEDWKLLTILIGNNDLCDYCKNKTLFSVESFIHNLTVALDMLYEEMPRMLVNLVEILPLEGLRDLKKETLGCLLQRSFCSCLILPPDNSTELKELIEMNSVFQKKMEELIASGRYDKRDDFAVILQPYAKNAVPPRLPDGKVDFSYFTPDCFHFTIKGHEEMAKGLWNNMFQPEGKKDILDTFTNIKANCPPVDHPYIYTRLRGSATQLQPCVLFPFLLVLGYFFGFVLTDRR
ncbi:phospholipase B1, membrane-associated [Acipenser ruthenus]|uniref:phospholipase B1, membrane-associated n=1 Tax=Acipenser ruthenus TaxID=7906 RepID=UPI0027415EF8|nr:phospholipase B1, membrane-associated [Acipenser ruthenus]